MRAGSLRSKSVQVGPVAACRAIYIDGYLAWVHLLEMYINVNGSADYGVYRVLFAGPGGCRARRARDVRAREPATGRDARVVCHSRVRGAATCGVL